MQIKSQATRNLDDCRNKLFKYMRENNIKPYGTIVEFRKGFKMWGEKIENGKASSNLYYVDYECIAKWRGNRIGWESLVKTKKKVNVPKIPYCNPNRPLHPFKAIYDGKETLYENARKCAESLGIDVTYVYQMSRNGKTYKGIRFEKMPLRNEE